MRPRATTAPGRVACWRLVDERVGRPVHRVRAEELQQGQDDLYSGRAERVAVDCIRVESDRYGAASGGVHWGARAPHRTGVIPMVVLFDLPLHAVVGSEVGAGDGS